MKNIEYGFPYVDMANPGILRGVCRITKFIVSLSPAALIVSNLVLFIITSFMPGTEA